MLVAAGVRLVGIDTPSVDAAASEAHETHRILAAADIVILENLVLDHVQPGLYELLALPLKLTGMDASPVRAILQSHD
jgi:arylformamidase